MTEDKRDPIGPDDPDDAAAAEDTAASRARRRRALDEVFGDVVPSVTRDENDPDGSSPRPRGGTGSRDEEIRRDVPPHHV